MTTCREESFRWIHRYAIGGAAFAALPIPMSTSAGLAALETHMFAVIGGIYGDPPSGATAVAATGVIGVGGQVLKFAVMQAALLVPGFGTALRMGVAGATIEGMGRAIVNYYERKYPNRVFTKT